MAFIHTRGNDRHIIDAQVGNNFIASFEGLLQSDFKRSAIRLFTDAEYVSAQIDDGALYISAYKIFLQPVGDKSLCNRAEVDGGVRAAKGEYVAIQPQVFPVDTGGRLTDFLLWRNYFFTVCEIPEGAERFDGDIESPVRNTAVVGPPCLW